MYDKKLPANAKLLYGVISSLCNKKGYCWAGNAYFAELYGTSERTVINWINALRDAGHITVEFTYIAGKKEIEDRLIKLAGIREDRELSPKKPPGDETPRPDAGSGSEVVKNSSPRGEKNFTTYGKNLQEVVKKFSKGGEKNFRDNIISNIIPATTTAADPPQPQPGPPIDEPAAAAVVSPQELKAAYAAVDRNLVFDRDFYPKAAAFMAAHGLDLRYLSWLFARCELKNPRSLDGLFYRLFFAENMVEQFKSLPGPAARPPPEPCPACGSVHDPTDVQCPSCGLERNAPPEALLRLRELYSLPPDIRAEFFRRQEQITRECGSDFRRAGPLFSELEKEFGLFNTS